MKPQKILYIDPELRVSYGVFPKPDLNGINKSTLHAHPDYCELLCIFKGKGSIHVEGTHYPIFDGCFMLARPNEAHYMQLDPSSPYERAVIYFSPGLLDSIDPERRLLRPYMDREAGRQNHYTPIDSTCMELMQKILANPDRLNTILCLIGLLQQFCAMFAQGIPTPTQETPEHKIIHYINEHPQESFSTQSLCSKFFISRTQLYRRFKKATGTSVSEYINKRRVQMARQLILQGQKPTQVYSQCGFQDYSTFFRAYRKHLGCSPTQEETLADYTPPQT